MSEDFYYKNEMTTRPFKKTPLIYNHTMPWNASGDLFEFGMGFHREKFFNHYEILNYSISNIFQPVDGILVIVNSPDELSTQAGHRFYAQADTHHDLAITAEITSIGDDLKSWPIEDRNCFLPDEKKLDFFRIYTKSNCEQECFSKAAEKTCGCVPFYVIRKNMEFKVCSFLI